MSERYEALAKVIADYRDDPSRPTSREIAVAVVEFLTSDESVARVAYLFARWRVGPDGVNVRSKEDQERARAVLLAAVGGSDVE